MRRKNYTVADTAVHIDRLVPGGQALGTLDDGKKAFFWNALPGETVTSYQVTKSKSSYLEAIALSIAEPSPHRTPPRDNCYLSTSPWQIMDYDYELHQKSALVQECFRQAGVYEPPCGDSAYDSQRQRSLFGQALCDNGSKRSDEPHNDGREEACLNKNGFVVSDNRQFHYRNKMEYSLYWDNSTSLISLAFHTRGSHRKLPITQSSLERPEIFQKAQSIIADLNSHGDEARRYQSLMLRCDQAGHVSGGLFENGQPHPHFPSLADTILGHAYHYSPNGFFQVNLPVYELALREIARHIQTTRVLDLYSGVGTIGLSVARDRELTLVETNGTAYAELEHNCTEAPRATPILANSEDTLDFIRPDQTIILDPPRAGCHPRLLERLFDVAPPTIIYLSCNPITQARDLRLLQPRYTVTSVQPYNFFPRTPHIENLVILHTG